MTEITANDNPSINAASDTSEKRKSIYGKRPIYKDFLPPCNNACPIGANIQAWLSLAQAGKFKNAWEKIVENNPMPAIHGRVCYHKCEKNCNRQQLDSAVNVHAIERFIGDLALSEGWKIPEINAIQASVKKILVIGAGPAGLSAAYQLKRKGHEVTIYEAMSHLGGMMYLGIPDYRLPANVLAQEAQRIIDVGINLELNHKVDDVIAEKEHGKFDAVFIGIGAYCGKMVETPTNNPCPMWDSLSFLSAVKNGTLPKFGDNLVVYGGSNTAMDVVRTAKRLGIKNVTVIYHRTRQRMAAFQDEITEALEEGVELRVLRQIQCVENKTIELNVVELDAAGSPQPTGLTEIIAADMLVFALGQTPDSAFLKKIPGIEFKPNGCIIVDGNMMTGHAGIFAGGDVLPLDQSVTDATSHGKKAARSIDAYLQGNVYLKPKKSETIAYNTMSPWFYEKSEPVTPTLVDPETRVKSFDEVIDGLNSEQALYEAKRCLSCGNCFECDGCYGVCPESAINKCGIGKGYKIDSHKCTGCGACSEQCPCGALIMHDE